MKEEKIERRLKEIKKQLEQLSNLMQMMFWKMLGGEGDEEFGELPPMKKTDLIKEDLFRSYVG